MKIINKIFIIMFFCILLLPILFFNYKEDDVSVIDNRKLTNNPFINDSDNDLTDSLYDYMADRIGFRNYFVRSYLTLNDKLFNVLVHPSYEYGKNGYVFFKESYTHKLEGDDYYVAFINMLVKINNYCNSRGVSFIFAFEPSKSSVLSEYINEGINYENDWVNDFLKKISDRGINVVSNFELLQNKAADGEVVFNKKYDAGHWNDLGAFYGVNNILKSAKKVNSNVHINSLDEFVKSIVINKFLPASEFIINESSIVYNLENGIIINISDKYRGDILLDAQHAYFDYTINSLRKQDNTPKTLVFQGSYMNGYGHKFFENGFYEYISVHNYSNIMNFDYYFNLFNPELVIFELTEYTLYDNYFKYSDMLNFDLNPSIKEFDNFSTETYKKEAIIVKHDSISNIYFDNIYDQFNYAYIQVGNNFFDARYSDGKVSATIENSYSDNDIKCILVNKADNSKIIYKNI